MRAVEASPGTIVKAQQNVMKFIFMHQIFATACTTIAHKVARPAFSRSFVVSMHT